MKNDKFYEKEQPELVIVKGGELRFYKEGQRLAVSKPSWSNDNGVHMGKTVTIDLAVNKGNLEMIKLFETAVELLKDGVV